MCLGCRPIFVLGGLTAPCRGPYPVGQFGRDGPIAPSGQAGCASRLLHWQSKPGAFFYGACLPLIMELERYKVGFGEAALLFGQPDGHGRAEYR